MTESESKTSSNSHSTLIIVVVLLVVILVGILGVIIGVLIGQNTDGGSSGEGEIPPPPAAIPAIQIISAAVGESVTIEASNFPPNAELQASIGKAGGDGSDGIPVGSAQTDGNGNLATTTFPIPSDLAGEVQLIIRLDGPSGYFAYHGFSNQ